MKKHSKIVEFLLQILNFIFAGITIALVIIGLFRPDLVELFITWVGTKILLLGNLNYIIAFGSSIIESFPVLGVVIPGQQIMLMVGGFFGKNNLVFVIIVAIAGALIGNYIGYFLGVRYGEVFLKKYGDWFGLGRTELRILKKQIEKNGAYFIIFGKFHNFTRAFVPFIAGSMGMKKHHFWLFNIIGSILWAFSIILLGVVFVSFYAHILKYLPYVLIGILVLTALYIYFFKRESFIQYLKDKNEEIEEKINEKKKII
ncbi:DedA family protein [Candidatus Gracilibacteria bacterium]|nr:DedA family protein [Candidatus Gracilibacteria bacterium]